MKIKLNKGTHYPYLIPLALPFWVKKENITTRGKQFKFTSSCMFNLYDEDQWDVNKLFGFSIGHHHNGSSFRFGWRPILKNNTIEIVAYEYHNGIRQKTMPIYEINLCEWYQFYIIYNPKTQKTHYIITQKQGFFKTFSNNVNLRKKWGLGYTLGVYFGGNEKAPQNIFIYKKNK
jgi:hypothetical protein